jgi:hypothetical protein
MCLGNDLHRLPLPLPRVDTKRVRELWAVSAETDERCKSQNFSPIDELRTKAPRDPNRLESVRHAELYRAECVDERLEIVEIDTNV